MLPHLNCQIKGSRVTAVRGNTTNSALYIFQTPCNCISEHAQLLAQNNNAIFWRNFSSYSNKAHSNTFLKHLIPHETASMHYNQLNPGLSFQLRENLTLITKRLTPVPYYTSRKSRRQNDSHSRGPKPSVIMTKPLATLQLRAISPKRNNGERIHHYRWHLQSSGYRHSSQRPNAILAHIIAESYKSHTKVSCRIPDKLSTTISVTQRNTKRACKRPRIRSPPFRLLR